MCKEIVEDGTKECQDDITCKAEPACKPGEYCTAGDKCKEKQKPKSEYHYFWARIKSFLTIFIEPCNSNSDCSKSKKRTVCRESEKTGEKTCRKPNKTSCKVTCEAGEFCAADNTCKNGNNILNLFL